MSKLSASHDEEAGVSLYHVDCVPFMKEIARKHPSGLFDMIFANPPYFLFNGGSTCHAGKMVKVDKGKWDKSQGSLELNHEYNLLWLGLCQKLSKQNGTIWVSETYHVIYSIGFAMQQLEIKILNLGVDKRKRLGCRPLRR